MSAKGRFGPFGMMLLLLAMLLLSGCGLLFGSRGAAPTPTLPPRTPVPTFTPTPVVAEEAPPAAAAPAKAAPVQTDAQPSAPAAVETPVPQQEPAAEPTPEPPTATPIPELAINIDIANVRSGPGTGYGLVGSVNQDQVFAITGKNPEGTWWQFCCVNGQQGWIFGELVRTENSDFVAVAENIPDPPPVVAVAPAPAPQPAPAPTDPPPPPKEEAPAPPPSNPCPALDRCTFRLRNGPVFTENGGQEIKLTLAFIHSGRGSESQGSYFVGMSKDGVNLGVPDSVRSWTGEKRQGVAGAYNYEYKIGRDKIPGNNTAGNYQIWVVDGNGNQASPNFSFSIPGSQGEVWIEFDQG